MKIRVLPYKMGSESARTIARAIGALRIYPDRGTYVYKRNHIILNWGNGRGVSTIPSDAYINRPECVRLAANKIDTLSIFYEYDDVPHPEFTLDKDCAKEWVDNGDIVYCRTTVTGNGGEGIVIATSLDEIVDAKLYTKGVQNENEYRVHIFDGQVIDFVRKARRRGEENRPSHYIRNHKQGWVFMREGVELPEVVERASQRAIEVLGLTFGAVDVCTIKGTEGGECIVFEVNCACGLQGSTIKSYENAIKNYIQRYY